MPTAVVNPRRMQALWYQEVRQRFGLSANLAIRAMGRVAANRKAALAKGKPVRRFMPTSLDYDARLFSFWEEDWSVSLRLLHGRQRLALVLGEYQRQLAFSCEHCGYQADADFNGANMIARLGLLVNQPHGPGLFCVLPDSSGLSKTPSRPPRRLQGVVYDS